MKIRIDATLHRDLKKVAKKSLRSVSKQVATYIERGVRAELGIEKRRPREREEAGHEAE